MSTIFGLHPLPSPLCGSTRTTLSALRIGEWLFATAPGEPVTLWADALRNSSPAGAARTVVLGYAQDHSGYLLTPEDWLRGGYEVSINIWGPLEGQAILERSLELLPLALTEEREDGTLGGTDRVVPEVGEVIDVPIEPATQAGTVPSMLPPELYVRAKVPPTSAQPTGQVSRLGSAFFVWIGEDPQVETPEVFIEAETGSGTGVFEPLTRGSGLQVRDAEVLLTMTPQPLARDPAVSRTFYWAAEWQAVPALGMPGNEPMEERVGMPLGRYRFRVRGAAYELVSDPFEVVVAPLLVSALRNGSAFDIDVDYAISDGFRLLSLTHYSNEPLPVPVTEQLDLQVELSNGSILALTANPQSEGALSIDLGADADLALRVVVRDRFGNLGDVALQ